MCQKSRSDHTVEIVCYPRCGTCKKAVKWLEDHGIDYKYRDITEKNPKKTELKKWFKASGLPLKKFFNTSGKLYRDLGLKDKIADMSDTEITELLASDGLLVKRPVLLSGANVLLGFKEAEWEAELL